MFGFFKKQNKAAQGIFEEALARARNERLYTEWGVPDTFDGRFDALLLHLWPVFKGIEDDRLAQAVYDVTFRRLELALREVGAGDVGVSKQVRAMMKAFYGRLVSYDAAVTDAELAAVLRRNLYGTIKDTDFVVPEGIIAYARGLQGAQQAA